MLTKFKDSYPNAFKVLILATFIDMLGSFILYPFFALYITEHFGVGMIEVGLLFSIFSVGNIAGGVVGGVLADKYGRRAIILFALVASGIGCELMEKLLPTEKPLDSCVESMGELFHNPHKYLAELKALREKTSSKE